MDTFQSVRSICLFLVFACLCESGNGIPKETPNVTLDYSICNGATFSLREMYKVRIMEQVLDMAMRNVADNGYNYYASIIDNNTGFQCWSHAACNRELSKVACFACAIRGHDLLLNQCERNIGAQFQLGDCRVRREIYVFNDD